MLDERSLNKCIECGTLQPQTNTNYTLISSRYGWRLTRTIDDEGRRIMEWRCPMCWARYRETKMERARSEPGVRLRTGT